MRPTCLIGSAIVLKPSTLLSLWHALNNRKYRLLFSSRRRSNPGPKGPSRDFVEAVVQIKQHNPTRGSLRIAQQLTLAFDIPIDKNVVRRLLAHHYQPEKGSGRKAEAVNKYDKNRFQKTNINRFLELFSAVSPPLPRRPRSDRAQACRKSSESSLQKKKGAES